jgi:sodium-dependent dicarboxylate transporter 2/3/5
MTSHKTKPVVLKERYSLLQKISLILGPAIFISILLLPSPDGLSLPGQRTLAVTLLMAFWWITEALPVAATALLPLALFPMLGIMETKTVAPSYGDSVLFLFIGGFFLATTMQRWNLHKRLALHIVRLIGTNAQRIVLGFMLATAFISLFISNISATLLMYPIGLAVLLQLSELDDSTVNAGAQENLRVALMLGIAYSASVGGIGTLIGTPPNLIFAGAVSSMFPAAPQIGFAQWMTIGMPLVMIFLPIIWFCLTRIIFSVPKVELTGGREYISKELSLLGKMTPGESRTLAIFALTAVALIFRSDIELGAFTIPGWTDLFGISKWVGDTTVMMFITILLFTVPVNWRDGEFLLDWPTAVKIPWGLLLLFGGGIAMAKGFQTSGLADWLGSHLSRLQNVPVILMILMVCLLITFMTEVTSNTAITTIFMPVMASTAAGMGTHPFLLMIPAAISASCAFMLPVATPPNAVIFGSGYLRISHMTRAGVFINLIGVLLVTLLVYFLAIPVFDITPDRLPNWAE